MPYIIRHDISHTEFSSIQRQQMRTLFIHPNYLQLQDLPIIVYVLLSLGTYSNELQLFNSSNLLDLFRQAQLLLSRDHNVQPSIEDVCHITRRYILEQLLFIPGGTKTFD